MQKLQTWRTILSYSVCSTSVTWLLVCFGLSCFSAWKNPPHKVAGALKHVSVGEAGIWGVDVRSNLYYKALCGSSWTHHKDASNLGLVQVDVGKNVIWAINKFNYVYLSEISTSRPDTLVFSKASDWAQHISVSQKGHVWGCISLNVIHRTGVTIDKPGGDAWRYVGHGYAQISVGSGGVWGVTHTKKISYRVGTYGDPDSDTDGSDWENVESLGISPQYVSSGDVIYITDTKGVIYYRVGTSAETPTGTAWQKIGGNLKQVEALSGTFWGVDAENNVYTNEA